MKILFVSGNLSDGGAQRVIAVVASKLAEIGEDVNLLLYARETKEYPISGKVKVSSLRDSFEEYQKLSQPQRILEIRKYLKACKPDVAVGFLEGGYGLYLSSFGLRFKKIASSRVDPKVLFSGSGLRTRIDKMWFRAADAIVVQTSKQATHIGMISRALQEKSVVIANPVSEAALNTKQLSDQSSCRRFVMAGRLSKQKNYEMAVAAMKKVTAKYPDVTLDVYGKGGHLDALEKLVAEEKLESSIKFRGWTTNTAESYSHYDAYLMTSDYEGMPNALMEAMAVGLPCISTDCDTGPEDLIQDGENGYLIPVGDSDALARKMLELIEMPQEKRRGLAQVAHDTMKNEFNSDRIADKWLELFERIVKQ